MPEQPSAARATIHLLCGKTGSGKTSYALQCEANGAVRFSLDEWMIRFYGHHMSREEFQHRTRICEDMMFDMSDALVRRRVNVVIDHGFWTRASRDRARARLAGLGAELKLVYLAIPDPELLARLARRNASLPEGTFAITGEMFTLFSSWFEPPTQSEAHIVAAASSGMRP